MSRAQALPDALAPSMVQRADLSQPEETQQSYCRLVLNVNSKASCAIEHKATFILPFEYTYTQLDNVSRYIARYLKATC